MGKDAKLAIAIGGGLVILAGAYFLGDGDSKRSIPLDSGDSMVADAPQGQADNQDTQVIDAPRTAARNTAAEELPPAEAFQPQKPDDYSILDAALPEDSVDDGSSNEEEAGLAEASDSGTETPSPNAPRDEDGERAGVSLAAVADQRPSDSAPDSDDSLSPQPQDDIAARNEATEIDSDPELVEPVYDEPAVVSNKPPARQDDTNDGARVETHTVRLDDTLIKLARMYYGSDRHLEFLLKANPQIKDPDHLQLGTRVKLPPLPDNERRYASADRSKPRPDSNNKNRSTANSKSREYVVKHDDTFYAIASRELGSGTRWKEIYELNKAVVGNDPDHLVPGQILKLPASN